MIILGNDVFCFFGGRGGKRRDGDVASRRRRARLKIKQERCSVLVLEMGNKERESELLACANRHQDCMPLQS